MKIIKYIKQKESIYKLELDNKTSIKIHEDLILKYNLLINKELTNELIIELEKENQKYDVYNIAVKYIKTKLRSIKEMYDYLEKKGISKSDSKSSIDLLLKQGYLNDEIYTKALINDRINMSYYGPNKIRKELKDKGINSELIENNLIIFDEDIQLEKIKKLVDKQLKSNKNKSGNILKTKIQIYLNNLGYDNKLIFKVLNNVELNDKELCKKEYEKMYKKLSSKYEGKELEYKLKQKMYQKGFNLNDYEE